MTLMAPAPTLPRPLSACTQAADELVALGVGRAHTPPRPLRVQAMERKRFGRLAYERLSFDHDPQLPPTLQVDRLGEDRKSTRLNSSHVAISYAVFCLKKKTNKRRQR